MQSIYIIKLGGSILTDKNRSLFYLRKKRIAQIISQLSKELHTTKARVILVHGAGSAGHLPAQKYNLRSGAKNNPAKHKASIQSILQCHTITTTLLHEFLRNNTTAIPIHTSTLITNTNATISPFDTTTITTCLKNNTIPILYGSMVCDTELDFSICSGDTIIAQLTQQLPITKIFFATDVDGIYTNDPHKYPDAQHIPHIRFAQINQMISDSTITKSHSTDVTDGLRGKLAPFAQFSHHATLQSITLFNGAKPENFYKLFSETYPKTSTIITN